MTNADKFLKEGINKEELFSGIARAFFGECSECDKARLKNFFNEEIKPSLTEDERVILRNIAYDSKYKYIFRSSLGMLYLSENEELNSIDRLPAMHHLFQFIKERRRI